MTVSTPRRTLAVLALVLVSFPPSPRAAAAPTSDADSVSGSVSDSASAGIALRRPAALSWVMRARAGAARRLRRDTCLAILDDFTDREGRPLRAALGAEGVSADEFLGRLYFFEAPEAACQRPRLALTTVRGRIIYVCSARFRTAAERNPASTEAAIIHEALHALGLGENPPSSDFITERVLARCRD